MKKRKKFIETDEHLQMCLLNNVKIEVFFFGEVDYVGTIEHFDEERIKIKDFFYIRKNVKLKIVEKRRK